ARRRTWREPNAWQRRAHALGEYLAQQLGYPANIVPEKTDLLMKQPDYRGMQRHNTLGIAFPGIAKHVLERFGSKAVTYDLEVPAGRIFPGISIPGRSVTPRIDLLATRENIPRVIITSKWSVRHDRVNDITNECPAYKAAYNRIYRQVRQEPLLYYVLTNEYDPSRLNKMLDDSCVDGVVHVHKTAVVEVCQLDDRLRRLLDLLDLINETVNW
ncbi:MAG: hypothetical protein ACE5JU_25415, partial [Candidatus Binatia bacterium]